MDAILVHLSSKTLLPETYDAAKVDHFLRLVIAFAVSQQSGHGCLKSGYTFGQYIACGAI
jgi:hypothetical protein